MKQLFIIALLGVSLSMTASAQTSIASLDPGSQAEVDSFWPGLKSAIEKHLGRPYVWGSSGLKSFDCSGFLWRVMYENGMMTKRTTARKFYMMLPAVKETDNWKFGTVVFFDNLKHVGIIDNPRAFYHAQVSLGTNRSEMNSFWKRKIYGFRQLPVSGNK